MKGRVKGGGKVSYIGKGRVRKRGEKAKGGSKKGPSRVRRGRKISRGRVF